MTSSRLPRFAAFAVLFACTLPAFAQDPAAGEPRKMGPFTIVKEVDRTPVLNQGQTGTCWSFATVSFLETEVKRLSGKDVDLSEIWFARCAILEKARRYLEKGGEATFGEGGLAHDCTELMKIYGAVPESVWSGLPAGRKAHNHGEMFTVLSGALKAIAKPKEAPAADAAPTTAAGGEGAASATSKPAAPKKKRPVSAGVMRAVEAIVDSYLGAPPTTFEVDGKTYDPKTYAAEVLKLVGDDYVEVMAFGTAPFGGKAKLEVPDNWLDWDQYANITISEFLNAMNGALESGYSVALDTDVSEPGFEAMAGVGQIAEKVKEGKSTKTVLSDWEKNPEAITQEMRDAWFKDGSTTDDHLMHVVGVARHEDGRRFYLVKNSWGPKVGPFGGYVFLSEAFVRAKALSIMVHRDALKSKT
ncbi:MAG TPA: C1 family peptidase [Planctomycetota bacterium]|nr:C1 family peptidase [Planctomycetota bacterium]